MKQTRLILYVAIMYYYGMIPYWNEQKEIQRRVDMTVTLEDDKQYRD